MTDFPTSKPPLHDLLTEFGQAYMKLCTEGAEHNPRVEAAERAIREALEPKAHTAAEVKAAYDDGYAAGNGAARLAVPPTDCSCAPGQEDTCQVVKCNRHRRLSGETCGAPVWDEHCCKRPAGHDGVCNADEP